MSENVTINSDEWEAFLRDSEELIEKYDVLLRKVIELGESNKKLEHRLQLTQKQLQKAEETKRVADTEILKDLKSNTEKVRVLHSQVSHLLQTELLEPSPARAPEEGELKEEVEVGVVEITPSAEAQVSKESKTIEKILRERREAAMKLLKEDEGT